MRRRKGEQNMEPGMRGRKSDLVMDYSDADLLKVFDLVSTVKA